MLSTNPTPGSFAKKPVACSLGNMIIDLEVQKLGEGGGTETQMLG